MRPKVDYEKSEVDFGAGPVRYWWDDMRPAEVLDLLRLVDARARRESEAERDRLATALGAYIEGSAMAVDERDQLRARVAELEAEVSDVSTGHLGKWARAQIEQNRILQDRLRVTLRELQRLANSYKVERLFRELARAGREQHFNNRWAANALAVDRRLRGES